VIVANKRIAMPPPKNSEYHNAYNQGWGASKNTRTYDMQSAIGRYKERGGQHEDHFDMGWTDHASDYPHRFRQPDQFLEKYKAENSPYYDNFELHPETRKFVERRREARRRDDEPIIKYTEDDEETGPLKMAKDGGCTCWEGYERVPGTKPCASGSCRKKSNRERNRSRDAGKVKRHNVSEEGPLGEGKDDKMPDISNELGSDWYRRGPGGKYARNRRGR
jgi:hypothetical protein